MKIPLYQIDAFTDRLFSGNPAAVCPLDEWLPEEMMQSIAAENNLSETAFFVPSEGGYQLRWFTPVTEVDLCGHATLAAAFVVFNRLDPALDEVRFSIMSGTLKVAREGELLVLDLPSLPAEPCAPPEGLAESLGRTPRQTLVARAYMAVFEAEEEVRSLQPDMKGLAALAPRNVIVTAQGSDVDFVSRYFAPSKGVPEDPVTGSAHCTLIPYWSRRLGKIRLQARQLSRRGGELSCEDCGERVRIAGLAVQYLEGAISV